MTAHFELQPAESELQTLAEQYWTEACNRERQLEIDAFEAGAAIRNGDYSLANLEAGGSSFRGVFDAGSDYGSS